MKVRCIAGLLVLWLGVFITAASAQERAMRQIGPNLIPVYPSSEREEVAGINPGEECRRGDGKAAWVNCLRQLADATDTSVEETLARIQSLVDATSRSGRNRFFARFIQESQEKWRALRDHECNYLASFEHGRENDPYSAKILCTIRENRRRAASLNGRFAGEKAQVP